MIAITHIDVVDGDVAYTLRDEIETYIKSISDDENYLSVCVMKNEEDNVILGRTLKERLVVPIFMVSTVEGTNLGIFKSFLNLLPVNNPLSTNVNLQTEFYIHTSFNTKTSNTAVLGGTVIKGKIKKHQLLYIGPDEKGNFRQVEVVNIRCNKVTVKYAESGQNCTVEIKLGKFAL
mmetsp:Transcript_36855/g.33092  ORF Transcript_36855/g.33092 Transcript_36855/m.33092 type:complete len:176 (+) Transcript_36855:1166-1693(+)